MGAKKITNLVAAALLCFAVAGGAVDIGEPAPAFELPALGGEEPISLQSYRGKVIFLDFWASWCGPCLKSLPLYEALYQELKDQGLVIVAVNLDEDPADGLRFLDSRPVSYPVATDPPGDVAAAYGLRAMPTSYVIDREGRVVKVHLGFRSADMEQLRNWIEETLANGPESG